MEGRARISMKTQSGKMEIRTRRGLGMVIRREYPLYILALPAVVYLFIFHYIPMYGVQIAFKDFVAGKGISGSAWGRTEAFPALLFYLYV